MIKVALVNQTNVSPEGEQEPTSPSANSIGGTAGLFHREWSVANIGNFGCIDVVCNLRAMRKLLHSHRYFHPSLPVPPATLCLFISPSLSLFLSFSPFPCFIVAQFHREREKDVYGAHVVERWLREQRGTETMTCLYIKILKM